jgi:type 1 glutamine amidotransferase
MTNMTDSEINKHEVRAIDSAIEALRVVATIHGFHQEHYDSDWMDQLDLMIQLLRGGDSKCLRLQRHLGELAVPASSH